MYIFVSNQISKKWKCSPFFAPISLSLTYFLKAPEKGPQTKTNKKLRQNRVWWQKWKDISFPVVQHEGNCLLELLRNLWFWHHDSSNSKTDWYFATLCWLIRYFHVVTSPYLCRLIKYSHVESLQAKLCGSSSGCGTRPGFLKLQKVFVSICKTYLSQTAECICLKSNVWQLEWLWDKARVSPSWSFQTCAVAGGGVKVWHEILLGLIPNPVHRPQLGAGPKLRRRKIGTAAADDRSPKWPRGGGRWSWIVIMVIICIFELIMISTV